MAGKFALIIGNSQYDDSNLGRLKAPDLDVQGLEEVLKVACTSATSTRSRHSSTKVVPRSARRWRDSTSAGDETISCCCISPGTASRTNRDTSIWRCVIPRARCWQGMRSRRRSSPVEWIAASRSSQVLMLDCCHSGAFAHGAKAAQGVSVGTAEAFEGTGLGRVILTATDSTQYAWEGDHIIGDAETSLFTHFLIEGLKTGAADRDDDGVVTVDELYDYVREQVVNTTPRQTPHKWSYRQEGEIVLAQNPFAKRSALPPEIEEANNSKLLEPATGSRARPREAAPRAPCRRARAALAALKESVAGRQPQGGERGERGVEGIRAAADVEPGASTPRASLETSRPQRDLPPMPRERDQAAEATAAGATGARVRPSVGHLHQLCPPGS